MATSSGIKEIYQHHASLIPEPDGWDQVLTFHKPINSPILLLDHTPTKLLFVLFADMSVSGIPTTLAVALAPL